MIPKEFETISEYVCKQTRWTDGSIRHDRMEDVVRCKDCIVFGTHGKNTDICPMWHNTHIDPYRDFCSRGVRKTENSSEKPNNCETCKWGEWYRKGYDITMMDDECGGCCSWNSKWTPKTEPQTDRSMAVEKRSDATADKYNLYGKTTTGEPQPCEWCKFYDGENCFSQEPCKVKDEPTGYNLTPVEDEPQTDCAWK